MAQNSVRVNNRRTSAEVVLSSVDTHGATIAEALAEFDSELPTEKRMGKDGIKRVLAWLYAHLDHRTTRLADAEKAYVHEQADDPPVRAARDRSAAVLFNRAMRVRSLVEMSMDERSLADYGLTERPSRKARALAQYCEATIGLMRAKPAQVTDEMGVDTSTERLADSMQEALDALNQHLSALGRELRELEATMLERDHMLERWTRSYQGVAAVFAGMYRLAGRDDLADRIRPTSRRATGIEPDSEPIEDSPEQSPEQSPDELDPSVAASDVGEIRDTVADAG